MVSCGDFVKKFLAEQYGITPEMQFNVYGFALVLTILIVVVRYPGAGPIY